MAITQAMCTSFKMEILKGTHNFTNAANSFKLALYAISAGGKSSTTATLGAPTTAFTTTGEVASSGTYVTGGLALTNVTPTTSGTTAFADFADTSWTSATFTTRGAIIYNTNDSNSAVMIIDFGADFSVSGGTFTVEFPTAGASTAILRIA